MFIVIETHISHHRSLFLALKPLHNTSTTLRNLQPKIVVKYDYSKENLNRLTTRGVPKVLHTDY